MHRVWTRHREFDDRTKHPEWSHHQITRRSFSFVKRSKWFERKTCSVGGEMDNSELRVILICHVEIVLFQ